MENRRSGHGRRKDDDLCRQSVFSQLARLESDGRARGKMLDDHISEEADKLKKIEDTLEEAVASLNEWKTIRKTLEDVGTFGAKLIVLFTSVILAFIAVWKFIVNK